MQKRYVPITVVTGFLAVVAILGYLYPTPAQDMPRRILMDNVAGKVVFNHQDHAKKFRIPCQTCHHEAPGPRMEVVRCATCHGVSLNADFLKKHPTEITDLPACATCHHREFQPKDWGHAAHAEEYGVACRQCHHADESIEPEPQKCAACHQDTGDAAMPSNRDAVHKKCGSCHEDKFAVKTKGCKDCHTVVDTRKIVADTGKLPLNPQYIHCSVCHADRKTQSLIPGRMDAFHTQCMGCHQKEGAGPFGKEQCSQCHTK